VLGSFRSGKKTIFSANTPKAARHPEKRTALLSIANPGSEKIDEFWNKGRIGT
jgi:hypothetical protein